jgi:DNA gyrase/topoisomerase IV subunit A
MGSTLVALIVPPVSPRARGSFTTLGRIYHVSLPIYKLFFHTKSIRAAGRSTMGVKLLDLEDQDKVAAAVVIPPEEAKTQPEEGTLLQ